MKVFHAIGAYGRVANLKDWHDGKDFRSLTQGFGGTYFSKRDVERLKDYGFTEIRFVLTTLQPTPEMQIGFKVEI